MWIMENRGNGMVVARCHLCRFEIEGIQEENKFISEIMHAHIDICPGKGN